MSQVNLDKKMDLVVQGRTAALLGNTLRDKVMDQQLLVLDRLISTYLRGGLSPVQALAGVGEMAGLEATIRTLEQEARRGEFANMELHNDKEDE